MRMNAITSFKGSNAFLSNMYPVDVEFDGIMYPSVEHAFQAAKTIDLEERKLFRVCSSKEAKKEGRKVNLRADWDVKKVDIMRSLVKAKFSKPMFKEKLLCTSGKDLIEGNTWGDTFWGVCRGVGENHLGRILMDIRSEFESEQ